MVSDANIIIFNFKHPSHVSFNLFKKCFFHTQMLHQATYVVFKCELMEQFVQQNYEKHLLRKETKVIRNDQRDHSTKSQHNPQHQSDKTYA